MRKVRVRLFRVIRRQAEAGRLQIAPSMPRERRRRVMKRIPRWFNRLRLAYVVSCESNTNSAGGLPGPLLPELHEPQDLVGLLRLGDAGMGIAEDALGGIAGEEDQDALLAAAAAGDVVLLQRLFLGIGRDGVEVEIERTAPWQAGPMHLVGPGVQQPQVGATIDPGAVGGQVRALGDHVEAGEQGDPFVTDQVHDMALALLADAA